MFFYALIGVLATVVLIIVNYDIFLRSGDSQKFPDIDIYRKLLYGVMSYYITDILWGLLDSLHLTALLFVDTVVYYVAMAVGVQLWTQYVVAYLGEDNTFSRFLSRAGRFFFAMVVAVTVINCFTPVLFWFDENGAYHACPARHIQLLFQILLLLLTSAYTARAMRRLEGAVKNRYRTICLFGLVVSVLLLVQLRYPFLPLYTIGYMLGTCLLHTFVVSNEMEEYRQAINIMLRRQSELLAAASKAKSAFLSNMSHEIRTPINAVLGMNEMILRESSEQDVIEYASNIRTAGNTLLGLVNDILDFSRIEAGKMEIIPVDYDLSSVVNDLVNMIQTKADNKGLLLKLEFDPQIPQLLHGDEVRIKQVITNILTNAVKYTEKGSVTFCLGYEKIPDDPDGVFLKVAVRDTGIGIRPEDIEKLFSEFARIEEKRNRSIEGTGLGMNITKRLLELMDSSLQVESVYGEGSVFSFCLRQQVVKWEALGDYAAAYRASLSSREKYREKFTAPEAAVLIVDDTPMNLTVFKNLLKSTRVQINTAASGNEGLALLQDRKYDIIFLDHMMPEMDGIETLHELKSRSDNPNLKTPCVCLTANAVSGAREQYLAEGFDDYLTKPIDADKLEAMLMHYLPPEKVFVSEGERDVNGTGPSAELPDWLLKIGEIDTVSGLKHCGGEEGYLETLKIYGGNAETTADEIENFWRARDIASTTLKVHALKSTSRAIGAEALGALAEKLEFAGKAGDEAALDTELEGLLDRFRALGAALSPLYVPLEETRSSEDLPLISEDELRDAYESLHEFAVALDSDSVNYVLDFLDGFQIPESEQERVKQLRRAAGTFDWDSINAILL
ncbi:MAG: response regulator [Fretibacterium sp.]|nr:response regulator [Fretibacterium sp.]